MCSHPSLRTIAAFLALAVTVLLPCGCSSKTEPPIPSSLELNFIGGGQGEQLQILLGGNPVGTGEPGQARKSFPITEEQAQAIFQYMPNEPVKQGGPRLRFVRVPDLTIQVKTSDGWKDGLADLEVASDEKVFRVNVRVKTAGEMRLLVDNRSMPEASLNFGGIEWKVSANDTGDKRFLICHAPTKLLLNGKEIGTVQGTAKTDRELLYPTFLVDVSGKRAYEKQEVLYTLVGPAGREPKKWRYSSGVLHRVGIIDYFLARAPESIEIGPSGEGTLRTQLLDVTADAAKK